MADPEELDFSSYLVDLDEGENGTYGEAFAAGGSAGAAQVVAEGTGIPLNTHSAKNWSTAFSTRSIAAVSPSPPETTNSDSSHRGRSTPSTAPSSVASTSYPGTSGSWGTVKPSSNRTSPGISRAATPKSSAAMPSAPARSPGNGSNQASSSDPSLFAPPLSLSFNYDFAHDPSSGLVASPPSGGTVASQSTTTAPSSSVSTALPSKHNSQGGPSSQSRTSLAKSKEPKVAPINIPENAVAPSSGPQSSVRGHRSRQQSSSLAISPGLSASLPYWAPLTQLSTSPASPSVSHHTKPYCRPGETISTNAALAASSSASSTNKKTNKRKSTSTASISIPAALSMQHAEQSSIPSLSSQSQSYRDTSSNITSPISPSFETFASFSIPHSACSPSTSADALLSRQHTGSTSVSRPGEVPSASGSALSVFDPESFTLEQATSVAAAGTGGKWLDWASSQEPQNSLAVPPEVLSSVLTSDPLLTERSGNFRVRDSSLAPEAFNELDGQSPEAMAAKDPLATQLWRLYAKAKSGLPNGARMENITWRMMSLKLNKQRAAEAQAAAEAEAAAQESLRQGDRSSQTQTSMIQQSDTVEEDGRGRRGRSAVSNSASPQDHNEIEGMDWRKQSRSRSRAPGASGGMDWRAASRSRSRAPNMRISIPRGSSGFQLPTYYDTSESFQSAERTDVYAAPSTFSDPSSSDAQNQPSTSEPGDDSDGYSLIQATLKQLIASTEPPRNSSKSPTPPSNQGAAAQVINTTPLPVETVARASTSYSYVPPAPLPISPGAWLQPGQTPAEVVPTPQSSFVPSILSQSAQSQSQLVTPIPAAAGPASTTSQESATQSVEAYLSALEYQNSMVNMLPHRHVGSVPGLFDEQQLKHNQHSEYGFLPKLVRKTSFDASYPAQLAQQQQKSQRRNGHQPNLSQTNPPSSFDANSYSTPGTPSHLYNFQGYDFSLAQTNSMLTAPGTPAVVDQQLTSTENSATMEAFKRLQAAQAMQAASSQQQLQLQMQQEQQQQQQYQMQLQMQMQMMPNMQNMQYSAYMDPNLLAQSAPASSMMPFQFPHPSQMHINPAQTFGTMPYPTYGSDAFADPGLAAWALQSVESAPATAAPTPEDSSPENDPSHSLAASLPSSTANSTTNLTALVHSPEESSPESTTPAMPPPKKTRARSQSNAGGVSADGTPTICINCKTTNTPLWRRDENGKPLCNACQLFRKLHGSDRPVSLHNSVIKKRNRTRTTKEAPKKTGSRVQSRRNSISQAVA